MRIAITGGTGFAGLAIAEAALLRGHAPILLDLARPAFLDHPQWRGATFAPCDVTHPADIRARLADARPDFVIHGAALTPDTAMEHAAPAKVIEVNLTGTSNLLQAMADTGARRLIHLSSASVYGGEARDVATLSEDADLRPNGIYAITKEAGEKLVRLVAERDGLDATILRLGPLFGPWERQGAARPGLSAHGQILALHRAGETAVLASAMEADWVYSRDVGAACIALAEAQESLMTETFNLGAGYVSSPLDWARMTGISCSVAEGAAPANVAARVSAGRPPLDIGRLRSRIGFAGGRPLAELCRDHADWMAQFPNV